MKTAFRKSRKLGGLLARPGTWPGLKHKVAAAIEHENAVRSATIGTLVDVGANVGQFSLLVRVLHPYAQIHAFEPLTSMAARYRSLFAGDDRVTLHQMAAGEEPGEATINVSASADSSSLLPITETQDAIFPGTKRVATETIQVSRIDDVLSEPLEGPIFVKLDVQGFELAALKGMPRLLERVDRLYVEVSFIELYEGQVLAPEMIAWLADQGFTIRGAYNPVCASDGSAVQSDFLFARA
ncbi:FkbM family methyltransferase [Citromicrobium bathyomarinum]|uniref:FkbM family methyltransferase n=1 Tax=Citromicrobium bathyomarinum TaxID=72174 RepID=UPI00315ADA03